METKDLVLLMLIPIILMSIVVYTDKNPVITGAVTAKQEESNVIGTYSIMPSFKAKIDYDLNNYNKIKESLDFIIKCAEEGKDIETCVDEINNGKINNKGKSLTWQLNCDKGAEKVLYDFAEFLQECIDSDDYNCLCTKDFKISSEKIKELGLSRINYELEVKEEGNKIKLSLLNPNIDLSYGVNTNGLSGWIPKRYFFSYSDKPIFNLFFIDLSDIKSGLGPLNELTIYKNDNNPSKIKSIDFVRQEGDNLIYPEPQVESEYSTSVPTTKIVKKPADLHPCQFKPKNIYKFCVTQNNYKVMAYDKLDGQVKERNPIIKFASYIPDLPPFPLKNLEVFDRPKAEKSVLVKWDKSDEKDLSKFRIYYAESDLKIFDSKISTEELRKNPKIVSKEIDAKNVEITVPISLNECEFDYQNKKCLFSSVDIENGKLYYSSFFNSYIYSVNVPEDKKSYDFSVTAVDKNNNEINNIDEKQRLPIVKNIQSIDDLPPSSENIVILRQQQYYEPTSKKVTFNFGEKPKNNIDGSLSNDFNAYRVYYLKYSALTQEDKARETSKILDEKLKNLKFLASVNYEQHGQPFLIELSATNPEQNNVYLFVIIASGINGNPKEEQFKVKEIGATVLQLVIQ